MDYLLKHIPIQVLKVIRHDASVRQTLPYTKKGSKAKVLFLFNLSPKTCYSAKTFFEDNRESITFSWFLIN